MLSVTKPSGHLSHIFNVSVEWWYCLVCLLSGQFLAQFSSCPGLARIQCLPHSAQLPAVHIDFDLLAISVP